MKVFAIVLLLLFTKPGLPSVNKLPAVPLHPDIDSTQSIIPFDDNTDIQINCTFYDTQIWITNDFLVNNVSIQNLNRIGFLDANKAEIAGCSYTITGADLHITLNQFGQCAQNVQNTGAVTEVSYLICVFPDDPEAPVYYTRDRPTLISLLCPYYTDIYGEHVIKPEIKKIVLPPESATGKFDVKFSQCNDSSCDFSGPTDLVVAAVTTYIGLEICDGENLDLILEVLNCWATTDNDSNSSPRYDIIKAGCAYIDPMVPDSNEIHKNFVSYQAVFSFLGFVWTNLPPSEQFIFLHCDVKFCPASANCSADEPACEDVRVRRSAEENEFGETQRASYGPIKIQPCDKERLGCSHDCTFSPKVGDSFCICPKGLTLGDDLRTCEEPIDSPDEVDYDAIPYEDEAVQVDVSYEFVEDLSYLLYGLIVGLVMASALFYWIVRKKPSEKSVQSTSTNQI